MIRWFVILVSVSAWVCAAATSQAGTIPVAGAFFHFTAEDITAGNLRVDGPDSYVTMWPDSTGNGADASNGDANQPKYIVNGSKHGDRPVVLFDGVNDRLVGAANLIGTPGATAFLVARQDTNVNGVAVSSLLASNVKNREMSFQHEPSGEEVRYNYRAAGANGGTQIRHNVSEAVGTDWTQQTLWFDGTQAAGSNVKVYHNYNNTPDLVGGTAATALVGYAQVLLGDLDLAVAPWNGEIAEFIMFDVALDDNQLASMHSYLENKWNQPIPEPCTVTLLGIAVVTGGMGLGFRRR